jgi:hypothetical protein
MGGGFGLHPSRKEDTIHQITTIATDLTETEMVAAIPTLTDDQLDELILITDRAAVANRLARIERGSRTQRISPPGKKLLPGSSFSQAEMNRRSEEMLVAEYDPSPEEVGGRGWKTLVRIARGERKRQKAKEGNTTLHPAKFSDPILEVLDGALPASGLVLDPFAGTGRIHELATETRHTVGVEIESEWADMHPDTREGDALNLAEAGFGVGSVDAICTSPTYGNTMADSRKTHFDQRGYSSDLGRPTHPDSSGALLWGPAYREFHVDAWAEAWSVLRVDGLLIINISDHIRDGEHQGVHLWHAHTLGALGLKWVDVIPVETSRYTKGQGHEARVETEWVLVFRK